MRERERCPIVIFDGQAFCCCCLFCFLQSIPVLKWMVQHPIMWMPTAKQASRRRLKKWWYWMQGLSMERWDEYCICTIIQRGTVWFHNYSLLFFHLCMHCTVTQACFGSTLIVLFYKLPSSFYWSHSLWLRLPHAEYDGLTMLFLWGWVEKLARVSGAGRKIKKECNSCYHSESYQILYEDNIRAFEQLTGCDTFSVISA